MVGNVGDFCRRKNLSHKRTISRWPTSFQRCAIFKPAIYRGETRYSHIGNRDNHEQTFRSGPGTLDFLLLKILAVEPLHGFAISRRLRHVSDGVLQVSDGSLYPALHKLEQKGWISAQWKPTANNRRAKFYALTKIGRKHLSIEADHWDRLSTAIVAVMNLKEA